MLCGQQGAKNFSGLKSLKMKLDNLKDLKRMSPIKKCETTIKINDKNNDSLNQTNNFSYYLETEIHKEKDPNDSFNKTFFNQKNPINIKKSQVIIDMNNSIFKNRSSKAIKSSNEFKFKPNFNFNRSFKLNKTTQNKNLSYDQDTFNYSENNIQETKPKFRDKSNYKFTRIDHEKLYDLSSNIKIENNFSLENALFGLNISKLKNMKLSEQKFPNIIETEQGESSENNKEIKKSLEKNKIIHKNKFNLKPILSRKTSTNSNPLEISRENEISILTKEKKENLLNLPTFGKQLNSPSSSKTKTITFNKNTITNENNLLIDTQAPEYTTTTDSFKNKKNIIIPGNMDCIEDLHFEFVKYCIKSKKLIKNQECRIFIKEENEFNTVMPISEVEYEDL